MSADTVATEHEHQWRYGGPALEHDRCERPKRLLCHCGAELILRCQASSRARCGPCSDTYRRRVRRVFASGWTDRPTDRLLMLTLTAPGERPHFLPSGERCPCTPDDGVNLAEWNATAGARFSALVVYLRRRYGCIQYARAAECQHRGALHFHVLMRVERDRQLLADHRPRDPHAPLRQLVEAWGFGHEVDVQLLADDRAAGYCAKYVSKSASDREALPWLDRTTGELTTGNGRYRPWSASRRWGLTMRAIRQQEAQWWHDQAADDGAAVCEAGGAGALDPEPERSTVLHPPGPSSAVTPPM